MNIELLLRQSKCIQMVYKCILVSFRFYKENSFEFHVNLVKRAFLLCAATQHVRRDKNYIWCNKSLLLMIFVLICLFQL